MRPLHARPRRAARELGYDVWFVYGSLLGAVREGGYIGHDIDFDAAYVSRGGPAPRPQPSWSRSPSPSSRRVRRRRVTHRAAHARRLPSTASTCSTVLRPRRRAALPLRRRGHPHGDARTTGAGTRRDRVPGRHGPGAPQRRADGRAHLRRRTGDSPKPGFNWSLDRTDYRAGGHLSDAPAHQGLLGELLRTHRVHAGLDVPRVVSEARGRPRTPSSTSAAATDATPTRSARPGAASSAWTGRRSGSSTRSPGPRLGLAVRPSGSATSRTSPTWARRSRGGGPCGRDRPVLPALLPARDPRGRAGGAPGCGRRARPPG